mmetsp:Transcript_47585/g.85970  ORF Transcript_47585/g.85970 Transcript_47585/m.85970 type:complete len:597 (+) Transcript_47585:103-1893(+)
MTSRKKTAGRYHLLPQQLADDYEVSAEVLGEGATCAVKKAWRKDRHDQAFAVKTLPLHGLPANKIENFWAEVDVHLSMDHPHIVRLADVYETSDELHLVTECLEGGDVHDRWVEEGRGKPFSEPDAAQALWQMLLVVNYLHEQKIAHRDLKLNNFLYDRPGSNTLKAIDFGVARKIEEGSKFDTWVGTLGYAAPEVLRRSYGMHCDMFSLGVCSFNLLVGHSPFAHKPDKETVTKHLRGEYIEKPGMWDPISAEAKDFITKLLQADPERRLRVQDALAHPWLLLHKPRAEQSPDVAGVADALYAFRLGSSFRRRCLEMMAWSVSTAELEKVREAFLHINVGNNGSISASELSTFMRHNCGMKEDQIQAAFAALDLEGNNRIQYSEFLAALLFTKIKLHDGSLLAAFQRFDQEKKGEISFDRMLCTVEAWHGVQPECSDPEGNTILDIDHYKGPLGQPGDKQLTSEEDFGPRASPTEFLSKEETLLMRAAALDAVNKFGPRLSSSESLNKRESLLMREVPFDAVQEMAMLNSEALSKKVLSFECFCSYVSELPSATAVTKTPSMRSTMSSYLRVPRLSRPKSPASMVERCLRALRVV